MADFQAYLKTYFSLIKSDHWQQELESALNETNELLLGLTEAQGEASYQEGKWSVKDLVQHLIDAERIFVYRALRFAREDNTPLPGWDEVPYAKAANAQSRTLQDLLQEFGLLRSSTLLFFSGLSSQTLNQQALANGNLISVEEIGKLLLGHHYHHNNILKERYLKK